jgi:hypothetical protein
MIVLAGMKQQEVGENLHLGMRQTKQALWYLVG